MLAKLLSTSVYTKFKRSKWQEIKKEKKLSFSIPHNREGEKDSEFTIRDIVESTSKSKTDFMYSVILSGNEEFMLPTYIEKGLKWLVE